MELLAFIKTYHPSFVLVAETWLHPRIPDNLVSIPGYTIFRCDSETTIGYGGVCIHVVEDVLACFSVRPFSPRLPGVDSLFIDLQNRQSPSFTIGCVYRPRPSNSDSDMAAFLGDLSMTKRNLFIAGDFNMADVDWLPEFIIRHPVPM